jgi:hypothetical protein
MNCVDDWFPGLFVLISLPRDLELGIKFVKYVIFSGSCTIVT